MINKLAALPIRIKPHRERQIYGRSIPYTPYDYEILLRKWPAEPHLNYLAAFSGPIIEGGGDDLGSVLLQQFYQWSKQLAIASGHSEQSGIRGVKSVFLSPAKGVAQYQEQLVQSNEESVLEFLAFVIPLTNHGSRVAAVYPTDNTRFPQFYCLGELLHKMYNGSVNVHPATKEMLAILHKWLSDQHHVPYFLDDLFHVQCDKRVITVSRNQIHYDKGLTLMLTDQYHRAAEEHAHSPVDKYATNPYYGTDIRLDDKPDLQVVNRYYGMGKPDYEAIGMSLSKWIATIDNPEDSNWISEYPLHRAACENDVMGIRRLVKRGCYPDQLDEDGWSPLHYACWYGELEAVKVFIEECLASIEIQNQSGSTPLHFAAGKGCAEVVEYLLFTANANPSALDNEGRSPLAVCLECKESKWKLTEQLLRQAYRQQAQGRPSLPPPLQGGLLPHSSTMMTNNDDRIIATNDTFPTPHQPHPTDHQEDVVSGLDNIQDLGICGSLGNMMEEDTRTIATTTTTTTGLRRQRTSTITKASIHFANGFSALANFQHGSNTLAIDALREAMKLVDMDLEFQFAFALTIVSKTLAIQLGDSDKPLKLLEKWPKFTSRYSSGKAEVPLIRMTRNVFYPTTKEKNITDMKTLKFLYYDAKNNVINGVYPCNEEEAITLASIAVQLEFGDFNSSIHVPGFLKHQLKNFVPSYHISKKNMLYVERKILAGHNELTQEGHNNLTLYHKYLEMCRSWPFYGSTFYEAVMSIKGWRKDDDSSSTLLSPVQSGRKHTPVLLGINTLGFHIIQSNTHVHLRSYTVEELRWEVSKEKNLFGLYNKNKTKRMMFHTKQAALLHSLATEMRKEIQSYKKASRKNSAAGHAKRRERTKQY